MKYASRILLIIAVVAAVPVSLVAQGLEARLGPVAYLAKRRASFDGGVGSATGTPTGLELMGRWRFVGLEARLHGATFSAPSEVEAVGDVSNGQVTVLLGVPTVSLGVGYGSRSFAGALGSRSWTFGRLGLRSVVPIGASGLFAQAGATWYVGADNGSGRDAETRLVFEPSRFPLYVGLGYRIELFTSDGPAGMVAEESTGISLSAGLRYPR
jgi:hypothetical protein